MVGWVWVDLNSCWGGKVDVRRYALATFTEVVETDDIDDFSIATIQE